MSQLQRFDSASGLRPAGAFLAVALFLAVCAVWVGRVALGDTEPRKSWEQIERDPPPSFTLADRSERPLALFVERLDLVLSPNAAWQAHTPRHMAQRIHDVLRPEASVDELLARMLPDAKQGVITASLSLDVGEATRIDRWLACGSAEGEGQLAPIDGMWVEPGGVQYVLCWRPADVLDEAQRAARDGAKYAGNPLRWARHLADGLALAMAGEDALQPGEDEVELEKQRAAIWRALMPTTWCVAVRGFPAERAPDLVEMLAAEHIAYHQMRMERGRDRVHPAGPFEVLGEWNYIDRVQARRQTLIARGADPSVVATKAGYEAALAELSTQEEREQLDEDAWPLLANPQPVSGLERACDRLLAESLPGLEVDSTRGLFQFRRERSVRARQSRSYFLDSIEAAPPPTVRTTFDMSLAREVRLALDDAMELHKPAVAMAIVVELATGDVLAVDARSAYDVDGFPPLFHEFTPGSTFKVNVMACALEEGVVKPSDPFVVGAHETRVGKRTIHEAEASKSGRLTAAECLAHSLNGGLAQIGVLLPDAYFRKKLTEMGYAAAPRSGLGGEREGYLPTLPWTRDWTQASISFGHECKVTLWQHAAGLATVIRGGEYLPLRVLDSVEQYGLSCETPRAAPRRVFSTTTCEQVRAMMRLGAEQGTGRPILRHELTPGLVVGSKTGTAQKVPSELCVHVELAHNAAHVKAGTRCSRQCRARLKGGAKPHRECYTSSMCLWGRVDGDTRELMVLVVLDEPRGKEKYGARVAGSTALRILREALGETRQGELPIAAVVGGFAPSQESSLLTPDAPWTLEQW